MPSGIRHQKMIGKVYFDLSDPQMKLLRRLAKTTEEVDYDKLAKVTGAQTLNIIKGLLNKGLVIYSERKHTVHIAIKGRRVLDAFNNK